jgi:phosphatidylglycerophosphate synthase
MMRIAAFAMLAVSLLLGQFAPAEWTWSGPVAAGIAVAALITMVTAIIKIRQASRAEAG